mmetsp:Transcript_24709/g.72310  ORF Transcript_24709/g.72310 Transcript_24709/m.72310 type:complete len:225 (-) Transcript_24709:302-976(-)
MKYCVYLLLVVSTTRRISNSFSSKATRGSSVSSPHRVAAVSSMPTAPTVSSPRLKAWGNSSPFSSIFFQSPPSNFIALFQPNVTFPSASHSNDPSARIARESAMEEYPLVPSLILAVPRDTSMVPVEVRIPLSSSVFFTSSFSTLCQWGGGGARSPLWRGPRCRPPLRPPPDAFSSPSLPSAASSPPSSCASFLGVRRGGLRGPVTYPPPGAVTFSALALPSSS